MSQYPSRFALYCLSLGLELMNKDELLTGLQVHYDTVEPNKVCTHVFMPVRSRMSRAN
jgi:hypothetical protein